jgi:DNA-nicking Smr family endonuclease
VTRRKKTDEPKSAFQRAIGEVTPLRGRSPKRVMAPAEDDRARVPNRRTGGPPDETLIVEREAGGIVCGKRRSTHASILRTLEDPRLEVEAECDLHGLTSSEAEREVLRFVESCQRSGRRWVRVIVGKGLHSPGGKATLKDRVVGALSQRAPARYVLAFRTAPQRLGGTGALTVRLVDRL